MKRIVWSLDKGLALRQDHTRGGIGFEECVAAIENGQLLDVILNPSPRYPGQKMFLIEIEHYVYCVPFVETETERFLKTLFPSRKLTARWFRGKS